MKKERSDSLSQQISESQHTQLQQWLAENSYAEVQKLAADPPPDGFGLEIGLGTLSRYFHAHYDEIDELRQDFIENRACGHADRERCSPNYRELLADSASLFLIERYHELASHPVDSLDQLRKLALVTEKIERLKIYESHARASLQKARKRQEMEQLMQLALQRGAPGASPVAASAPAPPPRGFPSPPAPSETLSA